METSENASYVNSVSYELNLIRPTLIQQLLDKTDLVIRKVNANLYIRTKIIEVFGHSTFSGTWLFLLQSVKACKDTDYKRGY